ncbi:HlyC/CorC family transporter [Tepidicaulis sp. LMO-SS28]|uniref:HlyC/CorC family transporter n=1 Tax=Tepidicaulis sp. LMO-SS28 TaxID=3447455 RepID=UPI003EE0B5EE
MEYLGLIWTLLVVAILLGLSGFFSGSETSLTAASRARMHRMAEDGDKRAQLVNRLIADPERLIGAILLGNNLVNILASALATSVLLAVFGEAGVVYATFIMTALIVIFSEVLPKTYAITNPDRMALAVSPILRWVVLVFAPITRGVQFIVRQTLAFFNINTDASAHVLSAHDELRGAIDLHHREGAVVKRDRDMLGGILDLAGLETGEIMVHRKNIVMVDAALPAEEIVEQVLASPHTRIPLWKDDPENIIGILHAKDLARALAEARGDVSKISITALTSEPWFVPDTTSVQGQLNAFLRRKSHFALVVDEYGALMGLVTLEDILEEIVGDIADEHDIDRLQIRPKPDGTVLVNGSVTIRDINRAMDWSLPDDEATTIAGLVIHEAQTIPDVGQLFSFHGYRFEILRRQRNQITALRITPLQNGEDPAG